MLGRLARFSYWCSEFWFALARFLEDEQLRQES